MDLRYLDGMVTLSCEEKSANNSMERIDWKTFNQRSRSPDLNRFFSHAESHSSDKALEKIKISSIKKKIEKICRDMIEISQQAFGVLEEGNTLLVLKKKAEFRKSFLQKTWRYQKRFMDRTRKGLNKLFSEKNKGFHCSSFVEKYLEMCMLNLKTFFVQVYESSTKYFANKRGKNNTMDHDGKKCCHENRFLRETNQELQQKIRRKFSKIQEKEFSADHSKSSLTSQSKSPKTFKNKMEICLESVIKKLEKESGGISLHESKDKIQKRKKSGNSFQMSNAWAKNLENTSNRPRIDSFDNWSPLRDIWREMGENNQGTGRFFMANCEELKDFNGEVIQEEENEENFKELNESVDYWKHSQSFLAVRKPSWLDNQGVNVNKHDGRKNSTNSHTQDVFFQNLKNDVKLNKRDQPSLEIPSEKYENNNLQNNLDFVSKLKNEIQNSKNQESIKSYNKPKKTRRKWKDREDEIVFQTMEQLYPKKLNQENIRMLANELGRTESSIKYRIRILKKKYQNHFQNLAGEIMSSVVQRSQTNSIPLESFTQTRKSNTQSQSLRCETASLNPFPNSKNTNFQISSLKNKNKTGQRNLKDTNINVQIVVNENESKNTGNKINDRAMLKDNNLESNENLLMPEIKTNNSRNQEISNNLGKNRNSTSIRMSFNQTENSNHLKMDERSYPSDISLNINQKNLFDLPIISAETFNQLNRLLSHIEPFIKTDGATFTEICERLECPESENEKNKLQQQLVRLKEMCKINSRKEMYILVRPEISLRLQQQGSRFWEKGGYSAILDFIFTSFYHQNFQEMSLKILKNKVVCQFDLLDSSIQSFDQQFIQFLQESQFFLLIDRDVFFV